MKEKFACKNCHTRFNDSKNLPRILPCETRICDHCITNFLELQRVPSPDKETKSHDYEFYCVYCTKTHPITFTSKDKLHSDLPLDEKLLHLMRKTSMERKEAQDVENVHETETKSEFMTKLPTSRQNSHRKMSTVIDDVNANTNELNANIKQSKEKLLATFSRVESEINARAEKLITEISEAKTRLLAELNSSRESALTRLDDALDTHASIKSFQQEYTKLCAKLNGEKNKTDELNKKELVSIAYLAEDLNEKIVKTNAAIRKMTEKNSLRFIKPASALDAYSLIGKLQADDVFNKANGSKKEKEFTGERTSGNLLPHQTWVMPNILIQMLPMHLHLAMLIQCITCLEKKSDY